MKKIALTLVLVIAIGLLVCGVITIEKNSHTILFEIDNYSYVIVDGEKVEKSITGYGTNRDSISLPSDADLYCVNPSTKLAVFKAKGRVLAVNLDTFNKTTYDVVRVCNRKEGIATVELLDGEKAIIGPNGLLMLPNEVY